LNGYHIARGGASPRTPDEQIGCQLRDRIAVLRFAGLALHAAVPDAKTIWLYRDQLTHTEALARPFARMYAMLAECGFLAIGWQITDATVVEGRRPRLMKEGAQTLATQQRLSVPGSLSCSSHFTQPSLSGAAGRQEPQVPWGVLCVTLMVRWRNGCPFLSGEAENSPNLEGGTIWPPRFSALIKNGFCGRGREVSW
jgi:hypothetical protein